MLLLIVATSPMLIRNMFSNHKVLYSTIGNLSVKTPAGVSSNLVNHCS